MGSLSITDSSQVVGIGRNGAYNGEYVTGYISNVRIVKGTAVYTGAFTVPTSPLQATQSSGTNIAAITGTSTSLLTCQSNRFIDNSLNNFVITKNGDTTVSGFIPFTIPTILNGVTTTYLGSGYFDGTGDYLGLASNSSSSFGTSNFTVECWVYMTANSSYRMLLGNGTSYLCVIDGVLNAFYTGVSISSTSTVPLNTWTHVAFVRSSGTMYFYINGVLSGSGAFAGTWGAVGVSNIGFSAAYAGLYFYTGNISNFRIVNGTAVYTANFTPPTAPLTAVTNTQLLTLQTNQPAANKQFVDNSGNNFPITQVGNATQGTFSPYGANWSNYFDGTGDYLQTATAIFGLGTVFTVEAWIYPTSLTNGAIVFSSTASAEFSLGYNVNTRFGISSRGISWLLDSTTLPTLNTWNHVVVARGGLGTNQTSLYLNGTRVANGTVNNAFTTLSTWQVGYDAGGGGSAWPGYISNLRVVAGTDVYGYTNSTITSPTSPLTAIANTKLLTCQDNRFVDDSPNNFTLTRNGDVSVQRFSPFSPVIQTPTTYSTFFDGTGDSLTVASNAAFAYGTGAFTVEFWVYSIGTAAAQVWVINSGLTLNIQRNGSGFYNVYDGTDRVSTTSVVSNVWNHVAVVRTGTGTNQTNLYVNGVSVLNWTSAVNYGADNFALSGSATFPCTCYISNVRVVKGTAVYTANFTPPTTPLTAIAGTSLLTCQSATHRDNSANALTITQAGDAIPRQFNPFGFTNTTTGTAYTPALYGGSAYFDGTGDYLSIPDSDAFAYGTGNFTIESWIYPTATGDRRFYNQYPDSSTQGFIRLNNSTNTIAVNFILSTSSVIAFNSSTAVSLNVWTHFAFVRNGSTFTIYLNGVSSGTGTYAGSMPNYNAPLLISSYDGTNEHWIGYIADLRITKGTALYKGNFVPPLTPLTATAGTTLLLNMDKGAVVDSSRCVDLETVGDAKVRYETPYAGSYYSNYFDGSGDYLTVPTNAAFGYGTADFTIEFWMYTSNIAADQTVFSNLSSGSSVNPHFYILGGSNVLKYYTNSADRLSSAALSSNTWYHIALTRASGSTKLFVNGVQAGSAYADANDYGASAPAGIGTYWSGGSPVATLTFSGTLTNVRTVKGTAVYTANFTPPTAPLTAISGTSFLTCQSRLLVDSSPNALTITRTGNVAVRAFNPFQAATYSSMFFDGTGDALLFPASAVFPSGAGSAFTFEFWIYPNAQALTILRPNGNMSGLVVGTTASGQIEIQNNFAASILTTSSNALVLGTWNHVAITRTTANLYTIYINGLSSGSVTYTTALGAAQMYIGYNTYTGSSMNAYLADVRTTIGAVRYTAAFTPPTAPLPTS